MNETTTKRHAVGRLLDRIVRFRPIDIADFCATAGLLWGVLAVVPTWFGYFRPFNAIAMAVFSLLLAVEAYALRVHMRKSNAVLKRAPLAHE